MKNFFLTSLSKALNAYLSLDPESSARLKKLHGKVITIELQPLHFIFHGLFTSTGVTLELNEHERSDAIIRGTPLQLLGMVMNKNQRQHFFAEDVVIEGDATIGQEVINVFDEININTEECLSHIIGDVPAYHVSRFAERCCDYARQIEQTMTQNVSEYLHEEAQWFPTQEALQDFFCDIDALTMAVDRIDARFAHLKKNLDEVSS